MVTPIGIENCPTFGSQEQIKYHGLTFRHLHMYIIRISLFSLVLAIFKPFYSLVEVVIVDWYVRSWCSPFEVMQQLHKLQLIKPKFFSLFPPQITFCSLLSIIF